MSAPSKAWKVIKPHIPLIQFKKGVPSSQNKSSKSDTTTTTTNSRITIIEDDLYLPPKYQRKPLTELEMHMIETGGVPL